MKFATNSLGDSYEPFVTRVLRDQPPRRAPATLETRVLAQLERRATLPWWQQSYAFWPAPIRGAFLLAATLSAVALVVGGTAIFQGPLQKFIIGLAGKFPWLTHSAESAENIFRLFSPVWHALSPLWFYVGAAFIGGAYAMLIGVSAAAYRTLHAPRF